MYQGTAHSEHTDNHRIRKSLLDLQHEASNEFILINTFSNTRMWTICLYYVPHLFSHAH